MGSEDGHMTRADQSLHFISWRSGLSEVGMYPQPDQHRVDPEVLQPCGDNTHSFSGGYSSGPGTAGGNIAPCGQSCLRLRPSRRKAERRDGETKILGDPLRVARFSCGLSHLCELYSLWCFCKLELSSVS